MRTAVTVLAGLAVIYFGTTGQDPEEGEGISGGLVVLAVLAALLVWHLTKPGDNAAK
ncbi:amidophosphoribosyltransferase [Micromonospora sp. H33]|uniref:amidophosphoribosyltransferase n=1 Tax=Micromonospora sp. H33 TaxID=3452215 RepID=UPI003F8994FC